MKILSNNIKANHRSFLSLDFLPDRPPSRLKGLSLADVDVPKHWRKKSEATTSTAPSIASSPAKSFTSDFSSEGGDLLLDEIEQLDLDAQALRHVAKLMSDANGSNLANNLRYLQEQVMASASGPTLRPRRPTESSRSSDDKLPTIRRPQTQDLATRRGGETMHISTNIELTPPYTAVPLRNHSRRPFSFYAGDDKSIMTDLRTAPPDFIQSQTVSPPAESLPSSPEMPLRRHSSLIPGPVPEHVLARPRREDSSSSVITSLQRSPIGVDSRPSTSFSQSGSTGSLSRVSSVSVLGDRSNDRGAVGRVGEGCVRTSLTPVDRKMRNSVQSLVLEMEMKGKDGVGSETGKGEEVKGRKKSPKLRKKENEQV